MALSLAPKASAAITRYVWDIAVAEGDAVTSASLSVAGGGIAVDSYEILDASVVFYVSGGTEGLLASIDASAVTREGAEFVETLYIAIRASDDQVGATVRDICAFALRPIVGIGEDANAELFAVALEHLNAMLDEWRIDGMDLGVPAPLSESDSFEVRDEFVSAVKFNLRVRVADEVGYQVPPTTMASAIRGMTLVANKLFNPGTLSFEGPCRNDRPMTGINDI